MSRRKKITIIIAVVLGILAIVLLVISLNQKAPLLGTNTDLDTTTISGNVNISDILKINQIAEVSPQVLTKEPATQSSLIAIAITFAERFGSYSNESNFQNIKDLKVMMTKKMQAWADNYIIQNQGEFDGFYGVTTRALSSEIIALSENDASAQVLVSSQREELSEGAIEPFVYYQKILINFVQENGTWLVDSASWQ